jgi:hypothetical protein
LVGRCASRSVAACTNRPSSTARAKPDGWHIGNVLAAGSHRSRRIFAGSRGCSARRAISCFATISNSSRSRATCRSNRSCGGQSADGARRSRIPGNAARDGREEAHEEAEAETRGTRVRHWRSIRRGHATAARKAFPASRHECRRRYREGVRRVETHVHRSRSEPSCRSCSPSRSCAASSISERRRLHRVDARHDRAQAIRADRRYRLGSARARVDPNVQARARAAEVHDDLAGARAGARGSERLDRRSRLLNLRRPAIGQVIHATTRGFPALALLAAELRLAVRFGLVSMTVLEQQRLETERCTRCGAPAPRTNLCDDHQADQNARTRTSQNARRSARRARGCCAFCDRLSLTYRCGDPQCPGPRRGAACYHRRQPKRRDRSSSVVPHDSRVVSRRCTAGGAHACSSSTNRIPQRPRSL